MVLLTITPAIKSAIEKCSLLPPLPQCLTDDEPFVSAPEVGAPISHTQIISISKTLKGNDLVSRVSDGHHHDLDHLLRGSRVYVPPPTPKATKSPQYVALMARLREEEERRAYDRMVNPPPPVETFAQKFPGALTYGAAAVTKSPVSNEEDDVTYEDVNRQITLIINVLVTIIASSVTIWMAARYWATPARLALSMGCSVLIAAAEVAIYMGYIRRIKGAKTEEQRRKEAKEIVNTWVIDGKKQNAVGADAADGMRFRKGKHR